MKLFLQFVPFCLEINNSNIITKNHLTMKIFKNGFKNIYKMFKIFINESIFCFNGLF